MGLRGFRRAVSLSVAGATLGAGLAIGAHPFPAPSTTTTTAAVPAAETTPASLAIREARAAARLYLAEMRFRAAMARANEVPAPVFSAPAPIASVAPAAVAPVTQSASS